MSGAGRPDPPPNLSLTSLSLTSLPEPVSDSDLSSIETLCQPSTPKSLTATCISETFIKLKWEEPDDDGGCSVTGYILEKSQSSSHQYARVSSVRELEYQVDDLQPGTSYNFRVAAQNEVGTSEYVQLHQITTKGKPTSPKALTAKAISGMSIILEWEEPDNDGGRPVNYIIKVNEASRPKFTQEIPVNALKYEADDLEPGTSYMFGVAAKNEVGTSDYAYLQGPVTTKKPVSNETPEELVKIYSALTMEDIKERDITDYASENMRARKKKEEAAKQWILPEDEPKDKPEDRHHARRREINLVLVGKTGSGKSSTGNLILGEKVFGESSSSQSCTRFIEMRQCEFKGVKVNIVDTPGFYDTESTAEDILTEFSKVVDLYKDGIDGILYLFSLGDPRYTKEQQHVFEAMEKDYGDGVIDNCFAIITHVDTKKDIASLSSYLDHENENESIFGKLLNNILQKRVIGVNNAEESIYGRELQRQNIIQLITAKTKKRFCSDKFRKYQEEHKELVGKLPKLTQDLAGVLVKEVAAALRPLSHKDIKDLKLADSKDRAHLVHTVTQKVMRDKGLPQDHYDDVQKAVGDVLDSMIKRYTSDEFLRSLSWAAAVFGLAAVGFYGGLAAMFTGIFIESAVAGTALLIVGAATAGVAVAALAGVAVVGAAAAGVAYYKNKK